MDGIKVSVDPWERKDHMPLLLSWQVEALSKCVGG